MKQNYFLNNVYFFSSFLICLLLHANGATNSDSCNVGGGDGDGGYSLGGGGNGGAGGNGDVGANGNGGNAGASNDGVSTSWVMWLLSYSLLLSCWSQ